MKHSVLHIKAVLLITVWLSACIPEPLDVGSVPVLKPEIVVITQFVPDNTLAVMVTRTFGALEASDDSDPIALLKQIAVDDATVTIAGPAGTYSLLRVGPGIYGDVAIPFQDGDEYTLTVNSESLGEVRATTTVQPLIPFDEVSAYLTGVSPNDSLAEITYSLRDPREKNWYMFNVHHVEAAELIEDVLNPRVFTKLLDDTHFNGQGYSEQLRVFPRSFHSGDTIAVSLSNISKEYYDFMTIRQDNRFNFVEYLGEPVNYPTNILGGRGFFNLYVPDVRFFVLRKEP